MNFFLIADVGTNYKDKMFLKRKLFAVTNATVGKSLK